MGDVLRLVGRREIGEGLGHSMEAKRVKLVGIVGNQRNSVAPDVPTLAEQGFPGVDGLSWFGMMASAKTPPATVRRISDAIAKTLADPDVVAKFASVGMAPGYESPERFGETIRSELAWWGKLIKEHKIAAD